MFGVMLFILFSSEAAGKSCIRRRLQSGEEIAVDSVCEAITNLVRDETRDDIIALFTLRAGVSQHEFLRERKNEVIQLCEKKLTELEAQQCRFYLELLPLVDERDAVFKAAWFDAFGDDVDKQHGCSNVVNRVNEELLKLSNDPESPIIVDGEGTVTFASDPTEWIDDVVSEGLAKAAVMITANRRRLLLLKEEFQCTVVGGVAAAVVAGASVVGVALGSICRSFASHSVPLLEGASSMI